MLPALLIMGLPSGVYYSKKIRCKIRLTGEYSFYYKKPAKDCPTDQFKAAFARDLIQIEVKHTNSMTMLSTKTQ